MRSYKVRSVPRSGVTLIALYYNGVKTETIRVDSSNVDDVLEMYRLRGFSVRS